MPSGRHRTDWRASPRYVQRVKGELADAIHEMYPAVSHLYLWLHYTTERPAAHSHISGVLGTVVL